MHKDLTLKQHVLHVRNKLLCFFVKHFLQTWLQDSWKSSDSGQSDSQYVI